MERQSNSAGVQPEVKHQRYESHLEMMPGRQAPRLVRSRLEELENMRINDPIGYDLKTMAAITIALVKAVTTQKMYNLSKKDAHDLGVLLLIGYRIYVMKYCDELGKNWLQGSLDFLGMQLVLICEFLRLREYDDEYKQLGNMIMQIILKTNSRNKGAADLLVLLEREGTPVPAVELVAKRDLTKQANADKMLIREAVAQLPSPKKEIFTYILDKQGGRIDVKQIAKKFEKSVSEMETALQTGRSMLGEHIQSQGLLEYGKDDYDDLWGSRATGTEEVSGYLEWEPSIPYYESPDKTELGSESQEQKKYRDQVRKELDKEIAMEKDPKRKQALRSELNLRPNSTIKDSTDGAYSTVHMRITRFVERVRCPYLKLQVTRHLGYQRSKGGFMYNSLLGQRKGEMFLERWIVERFAGNRP